METTIDNGKENGNYYSIWGYIGRMENRMETTIVHWDLRVTWGAFTGAGMPRRGQAAKVALPTDTSKQSVPTRAPVSLQTEY